MAGLTIEWLPDNNINVGGGDVDAELRAERVVAELSAELSALLALDERAIAARVHAEREGISACVLSFLAHRKRETSVGPPAQGGGGARAKPPGQLRPSAQESPHAGLDRLMLLLLVRLAQLPAASAERAAPLPPATAPQLLDVAALYGLSEPSLAGEIISRALARAPALAADLAESLELSADLVEHAAQAVDAASAAASAGGAAALSAAAAGEAAAGLAHMHDAAFTLHALAACHPLSVHRSLLPVGGERARLAVALCRAYRSLGDAHRAVLAAAPEQLVREARVHALLLFAHALGAVPPAADGAGSGRGGGDGGGRGRSARGGGRGRAGGSANDARPAPDTAAGEELLGALHAEGWALASDLARAFPRAARAADAGAAAAAGARPAVDPASVAQVLELIPGLGAGFVAACLWHCAGSVSRCAELLLEGEGALPAELARLSRSLPDWQPPPSPRQAAPLQPPPRGARPGGGGAAVWRKSEGARTRELLDEQGAEGRTLPAASLARLALGGEGGGGLYDDDFDDDEDALPSSGLSAPPERNGDPGALDEAEGGPATRHAAGAPRADDAGARGRVAGPRSVPEWLDALGLPAERYGPLLAKAGFGRLELLPRLTEGALSSAGIVHPRDKAKLLAGARRLGERQAAAGVQPAAGPSAGASAEVGGSCGDDYFSATRLHYDRGNGGFWAEDGTHEGDAGERGAAGGGAAGGGAASSTDEDDEGEGAAQGGGGGGGGMPSRGGGRGNGRGAGRGRGRGRAECQTGAQSSQPGRTGAPRSSAAGQKKRRDAAYAKQGGSGY